MKTPSPIIVLAIPDNERISGRLNAKRLISQAYAEQRRKENAFEEILKQEYPQAHPNNRNGFNYLGVSWGHTVDKDGFISFSIPYIEIEQDNWLNAIEIIKTATDIYQQSINKYEGTNINDFIN